MSTKPKGADQEPETVTGRGILVFYAVGPDKEVLRSSVSNFRTVAKRWAKKRGPGYKVVQQILPLNNLSDLPEKMTVKPYKGYAEAAKPATKKPSKKVVASKTRKPTSKPKSRKATAPKRAAKRVSANAELNRVAV